MDLIIKGGPIPSTSVGAPLSPLVVDPTYGSARVRQMPSEYNANGINGGHYRAAQVSGLLTIVAAGGAVFSARWAPPAGAPNYMILKRVQIGWGVTTAFTTAQALTFDIVRCTGFTAPDTGGTAATPFLGNANKVRSSLMAASQMADMRIAAAAALAAGTKTQDANPFGYVTGSPTATVGTTMQLTDIYAENLNAAHPEMFGPNEGFNIRNVITMGAAGVINLYVVTEWAEVPGL